MSVAEVMVRFGTFSPASAATEQFDSAAEAGAAERMPAKMQSTTADGGKLKVDITRLRLFMAFLSFVKVFHRTRKSRASGEVRRMIWAAMTEDIEEEHGLGGSKRHDATSSQSSTKQNPAAHHRAFGGKGRSRGSRTVDRCDPIGVLYWPGGMMHS
jgi:hypothetical protein